MMKTKVEKVIAMGGGALLILGFLMCCSGLQFPFLYAKGSLNGHLDRDFGMKLPPSAVVEQSYWVGARDPEQVFKVQIASTEIGPFFQRLRATPKGMTCEEVDTTIGRFGPLYRTPAWWNNPPLADPMAIEFNLPNRSNTETHYRFLYSPTSGTMYVVWGGF
jgi:hypothetical protein